MKPMRIEGQNQLSKVFYSERKANKKTIVSIDQGE